jgi:Icc-related predicted phosphoesterase
MRILVVSDLHGDMTLAEEACRGLRPDLLLCCGDWGDPDQVTAEQLDRFISVCPVLTTFGNHDPLPLLHSATNQDGSAVLLGQGQVHDHRGLRLAAIGGIWAKSHRLPHYVTDQDVAGWSEQIAGKSPIDILLTHGCPIGLADLTPSGRHGGQRCFLEAQKRIAPRLHLCGHLHLPQESTLRDGRKVINAGATPEASIVLIEFNPAARTLGSCLTRIEESVPQWPGLC